MIIFFIKIIYDKSGELEQLPTLTFESFASIFQQKLLNETLLG